MEQPKYNNTQWFIGLIFGVSFVMLLIALAITQGSKAPEQAKQPPAVTAEQQPVDLEAQNIKKYMQKELYEGFGGYGNPEHATSWYPLIKSFDVTPTSNGKYDIKVTTDIYKDSDAQVPAEHIRGFFLSCGNGRTSYAYGKIRTVEVWGVWEGSPSLLSYMDCFD